MANIKEIRTKILSVQNTQKITKAMEMVAASKMRKTQDRMFASRPYAETIKEVIEHVVHANLEYVHPYLLERKVERVCYLVVSTDRGLCGSLNINLFKKIVTEIHEKQSKGVDASLILIGSKAIAFFKHMHLNILAQVSGISEDTNVVEVVGLVKKALDAYDDNKLDRIYIANNKFINSMLQEPQVQQLLPIRSSASEEKKGRRTCDYIYEPDPIYLLNLLLKRYIESQVYQSIVENLASEQVARMMAMKSATDNCNSFINDLQIVYNKVRQSSITNELIDIVSGANAVSN